MEIEKAIKEGMYFFSGILNFQKGMSINNTNPILSDAIRIGGTESFKTNLVKGNALPWAIAIKSKINKCFIGKTYPIVNGSVIGLSEELCHVVLILVYSFIDSIPASLP